MKNKITILVLLLAFTACKNSNSEGTEKDKIKLAHWLLGNWENKSVEGSLTENWEKVNDSTYKATSYFTKGKDTLHFETIRLQQKGETLTYIATVQGQNDDKPVAFNLITATDKQLVFENLKNDYPQKISYTQISKDSLVTEISGMQQGKISSEKYKMGKRK
nr:DUF6265 family protein [uncultured Flavobacterium sp.]